MPTKSRVYVCVCIFLATFFTLGQTNRAIHSSLLNNLFGNGVQGERNELRDLSDNCDID